MIDLNEISDLVQKGKAKDVQILVQQALDDKISAKEILNNGLCAGMTAIGEKFKNNEVYVPEVLIASRAMTRGTEILKPYLVAEGVQPIGKAVICTVQGDMHDIGKNLVKMMFEGSGIACIDLGTDVQPQKIVDTVKETGAEIVCLSALLTTTMGNQKSTIDALVEAGIRKDVIVMVGGAPVNEKFAEEICADIYTNDAASAATAAVHVLKNRKQ